MQPARPPWERDRGSLVARGDNRLRQAGRTAYVDTDELSMLPAILAKVCRFNKGDNMGLSDDLENLERLQREGALSDDEFRRAKAALLTPSSEATESPQSPASNPKR